MVAGNKMTQFNKVSAFKTMMQQFREDGWDLAHYFEYQLKSDHHQRTMEDIMREAHELRELLPVNETDDIKENTKIIGQYLLNKIIEGFETLYSYRENDEDIVDMIDKVYEQIVEINKVMKLSNAKYGRGE